MTDTLQSGAESAVDLDKLEALARAATPGPWMRLFGERTIYDRMSDGCRGIPIVRADTGYGANDPDNLDYIAAANPAAVLGLIALARRATAPLTDAQISTGAEVLCDCQQPKRIGRRAAIAVFDAMSDAATHPSELVGGEPTAELFTVEQVQAMIAADRAQRAAPDVVAGFKVMLDPSLAPSTARVQSGKHSVTITNIGTATAAPGDLIYQKHLGGGVWSTESKEEYSLRDPDGESVWQVVVLASNAGAAPSTSPLDTDQAS